MHYSMHIKTRQLPSSIIKQLKTAISTKSITISNKKCLQSFSDKTISIPVCYDIIIDQIGVQVHL